jgi:hypothetical protein
MAFKANHRAQVFVDGDLVEPFGSHKKNKLGAVHIPEEDSVIAVQVCVLYSLKNLSFAPSNE